MDTLSPFPLYSLFIPIMTGPSYDICCIGHITLDKVITPTREVEMAGGTSFYFSNAIHRMNVGYVLVTALAATEMRFVDGLRARGIEVKALPSRHTVYFENRYSENQDHRTQRVLQEADPFAVEPLLAVKARVFHLGPLLANDMSAGLIQTLAGRGAVSLDVQGYLRRVENNRVIPVDWADKKEALQYVKILKANEEEMAVLTGYTEIDKGARLLHEWGVEEVVITRGSKGSVIYYQNEFFQVPAYKPVQVADATGCGDTYMAGYLYKRVKGATVQEAGEFGAAMATLKIQTSGPFTGTEADVANVKKYAEM